MMGKFWSSFFKSLRGQVAQNPFGIGNSCKHEIPRPCRSMRSIREVACNFFLLQSAKLSQRRFSFDNRQSLAIAAELAEPVLICAFCVKEKSG